jgi:hypothetical protein
MILLCTRNQSAKYRTNFVNGFLQVNAVSRSTTIKTMMKSVHSIITKSWTLISSCRTEHSIGYVLDMEAEYIFCIKSSLSHQKILLLIKTGVFKMSAEKKLNVEGLWKQAVLNCILFTQMHNKNYEIVQYQKNCYV